MGADGPLVGDRGSRSEPQRHRGTEEDRAGPLMGADGPLMGDRGSRSEPQRHRGTEEDLAGSGTWERSGCLAAR